MIQLIGLIVALVFLQVSSVYADDVCSYWTAKVTSMQGVVEIRKHTTLEWIPAKLNDRLCASDSLRTASHSRATIHIQEETFMVLNERSTVRFSSNQENQNDVFSQLLNLFNGEAYFRSRRPRELGIETRFVNAMHEGTEFLVKVNQDSTQVVVFDGVVVASNLLGQVSVAEGQSALTFEGQAPVIGPRIELRDAVQWTLYYPPVIDYTTVRQNPSYSTLKPVLDRFLNNDLAGAFEQLENVSEVEHNADYQILYASLLLTVGQVEQAELHLNQVQLESQKKANVLALRSIIALAKSDQQQALKLAEQAQQLNPQAAAPKIALSYAYQSLFDIDKALNSAKEAAQAAPNNGLAWARVSEMELATGNVDASMEAARKAQTLNPKLAKTNTVLGFARLASLDLGEAEQSFRAAIKRDPSDPLARLGLGLAKIRQGHIKSGTKEMETAANLDPDNALIRSYLGKAYYEQRRGDIASIEYAIAKKLDPNDPTPWFYDAIYKQTVNRPVEALHDMQKAIELNDNRAVFRSKLLLDQDLASRSAALGRIYNDLGFQQRGLLEGWKSVNEDPSNYSAHRLLADNYAALPRHEIARVSELLQSQLLQPINITPVQPQLAESNLLNLDGLGQQSPSFNEFNPLFARNRVAFQASGLVGNDNTYGDEVLHSVLWNKYSYSLGQFHYQSDGHRSNNDLQQDIYNVFAQTAINHKLNLQGEFRHKKLDHGDLSIDVKNPNQQFRRKFRTNVARIGASYSITPQSKIIASAIYQDTKENQKFLGPVVVNNDGHGYRTEIQYLFRNPTIRVVSGIGYAKIDFKSAITNPRFSRVRKEKGKRTNAYVYSYLSYPDKFIWTIGVSFDAVDGLNDKKLNHINPKLGFIWNITSNTLLRAEYFRFLKGPRITDQTIEPTHVAGFNQFFDDITGTESKRYGIALDQKFSPSLFGGLEVSKRDLNVPIQDELQNWSEELYRAYLNWTPNKRLAIKIEYSFENFDIKSAKNPTTIPETQTHLAPVSVSYFDPTGLFATLGVTYVNQLLNSHTPVHERNQFVSVDTSVGYRFPSNRSHP